ncbi:MAG: hypothetical protein GX410_08375 [Elusimicrobia bacterium]|nr:hypothetical protein [Elusimicrobiota bacterium]
MKYILSFILTVAGFSQAQALSEPVERRAAQCEAAVTALNPDIAAACAADQTFISELAAEDSERASQILQKGQALAELDGLLAAHTPGAEQEAVLRATLSGWLGDVPFADMGLATPAQLLSWVGKYRSGYGDEKMASIKRALLDSSALNPNDIKAAMDFAGVQGDAGKAWNALPLSTRENTISGMLLSTLDRYISDGKCMADELRADSVWKFLPSEAVQRFNDYARKCEVMDRVQEQTRTDSKLQAAMAGLRGLPLDVQLFRLGQFFDQNDNNTQLAREVEALRAPAPSETLAPEQNELLTSMLKSSMLGAIRGVPVGDEIAAFYAPGSGNEFKLKIEDMGGETAEYRPATGEIVLNSALIQQFMRINGYTDGSKFSNFTTNDLLANNKGAMRHLMNFLAPVVVHEATHQMQHRWSKSRQIFDPYSKEDEVEAISKQSLFTLQKYRKSPAFSALVDQDKEYSPYMALNVQLADEFERDPSRFLQRVGDIYYPKVPSAQTAHSYTLAVIDGELKRRAGLPEEARHALETGTLKLEDALNMTNSGLKMAVGDFGTADLESLRDSVLARREEYVQRREQVVADALAAMRKMG